MGGTLLAVETASAAIRAGQLTPRDLVDQCLDQIERLEPQVQAWVLVDAQNARETADRLTLEAREGRLRGPLHGIPIGIKDLIDCQGWPTLAGTRLREGHVADHDAPLVARLRRAGTVILGKTVTTELASFDPGKTRNPWNLEHTPGGSSSGSAAAVAAGMCLAAVGTQTGGSITRPASFCGIPSLKPTFGRVPLAGIVPFTQHVDHPGPMATSVTGLAAMLQALAGHEPNDPTTTNAPTDDYVAAPTLAEPPRLGLLEPFFLEHASADIRQSTLAAIAQLQAAGATVTPLRLPASFQEMHVEHRLIMAVEAAEFHGRQYREHPGKMGPEISKLLEEGLAVSGIRYAKALRHQRHFRLDMLRLLGDVDAFVTPATVTTAPATLASTGDPRFNAPWSYTGLPVVSVPCGLAADGMPAALQIVGPWLAEARLLAWAAWCESQLGAPAAPPLADRSPEKVGQPGA